MSAVVLLRILIERSQSFVTTSWAVRLCHCASFLYLSCYAIFVAHCSFVFLVVLFLFFVVFAFFAFGYRIFLLILFVISRVQQQ